ncbi:FtsQ-type POTRA domain-containing protein [Actinomycetaceae bacterium TAE3-ERU4]|nr:FtsQ-type POTRA domain-containing protein [Actinomycetaceae bacterium TAE3-ERU4]
MRRPPAPRKPTENDLSKEESRPQGRSLPLSPDAPLSGSRTRETKEQFTRKDSSDQTVRAKKTADNGENHDSVEISASAKTEGDTDSFLSVCPLPEEKSNGTFVKDNDTDQKRWGLSFKKTLSRFRSASKTVAEPVSNAAVPIGPKFRERKKARQRKLAYSIGISLLVVLSLIGLYWLFFISSVFGVHNVKVSLGTGAKEEWVKQVQGIAKKHLGEPVFNLDTNQIESEIGELPYVKASKVAGKFPRTLSVEVHLRQPAAFVNTGKKLIVVDSTGTPMEYIDAKGLKLPELEVKLGEENTGRSVDAGLAVLASLHPQLKEKVKYVSVPSPTNVQLHLRNGALVKWGSKEESEFKNRVLLTLLKRPAHLYDLTSPSAPVTSN